MADDFHELHGRASPQELQIAAGNLPAFHVTYTVQAEQLRLGCAQPGIGHPVTKQAAHDWQEVQMAIVWRSGPAGEPEPCDEERPVEAATVVRDEPGTRRDRRREGRQERPFVGVIGEQQLHLAEPIAFPPAEPDQEGQRPGRGGQTGRLGIETDKRRVRRWLAGQTGEAVAIEWDGSRRLLAAHDGALGRNDDLAVDSSRQLLSEVPSVVPKRTTNLAVHRLRGRPVALEAVG